MDSRIVYGARCFWWDSIGQVATKPGSGLPCCPHCGSVLMEVEDEATWWAGVERAEADRPGYGAMLRWSRGRCFPTYEAAQAAYAEARA